MKPLQYTILGVLAAIIILSAGGVVGHRLKKCEDCPSIQQHVDSLAGVITVVTEVSKIYQAERDSIQARLDKMQASEKPVRNQVNDAYSTFYGSDLDSIADSLLSEPVQPAW